MGRGPTPDELRTAQIQRQHSQEMALRYLTAQKAKASDSFPLDMVKEVTDHFEADIGNSIQLAAFEEFATKTVVKGEPAAAATNGSPSLDEALALVDKIKAAPTSLHPMIKVRLTAMGIKGVSSLEEAVAQLDKEQAKKLDDFIDSQIDTE